MTAFLRFISSFLLAVLLLVVLWLVSLTYTEYVARSISDHTTQMIHRAPHQAKNIDEWLDFSREGLAEVEQGTPWLRVALWVSAPGFRQEFREMLAQHRNFVNDYRQFTDEVETLHRKHPDFGPLVGERILLAERMEDGYAFLERLARTETLALALIHDAGKLVAVATRYRELRQRARDLALRAEALGGRMKSEVRSIATVPAY